MLLTHECILQLIDGSIDFVIQTVHHTVHTRTSLCYSGHYFEYLKYI